MTPLLPIEQLRECIEKLSFEDLLALYSNGRNKLFEGMTIDGFIGGNLHKEDGVKLFDLIRDLRPSTSVIPDEMKTAVLDLDSIPVKEGKPKWFQTTYPTTKPDDPNTLVSMLCQVLSSIFDESSLSKAHVYLSVPVVRNAVD